MTPHFSISTARGSEEAGEIQVTRTKFKRIWNMSPEFLPLAFDEVENIG